MPESVDSSRSQPIRAMNMNKHIFQGKKVLAENPLFPNLN